MLLFILPTSSIVVEMVLDHTSNIVFLITKWFVFYAGLRLFIAGLRQTFRPDFTAKILGLNERASLQIVQELGFSNICIGLLGIISLFIPAWTNPSAFVSGIFYGLAGFKHLMTKKKNAMATFAMITDFWAFLILIFCFFVNMFIKN